MPGVSLRSPVTTSQGDEPSLRIMSDMVQDAPAFMKLGGGDLGEAVLGELACEVCAYRLATSSDCSEDAMVTSYGCCTRTLDGLMVVEGHTSKLGTALLLL